MPLSLSVVSAIHYARRAKTPFQRAESLSWLLKKRIGAYGLVGFVSAAETIDTDSKNEISLLSLQDIGF